MARRMGSMGKGFLNIGNKVHIHPDSLPKVTFDDVVGEAEVPFFNISGSEFIEMFVGAGACDGWSRRARANAQPVPHQNGRFRPLYLVDRQVAAGNILDINYSLLA